MHGLSNPQSKLLLNVIEAVTYDHGKSFVDVGFVFLPSSKMLARISSMETVDRVRRLQTVKLAQRFVSLARCEACEERKPHKRHAVAHAGCHRIPAMHGQGGSSGGATEVHDVDVGCAQADDEDYACDS